MSAFETQEWETLEMEAPGYGEFEDGELEWEAESAYENQEQELLAELFGPSGSELESPLNEMQEMELAAELLAVTSEAELEQFLGRVMKAAGRAIRSPVGRALGGALKGIARRALPQLGGIAGSFLLPGVGGVVGRQLGSWASRLFELEFENMNEQEAEFEISRRFVRFTSAAARNAARAPQDASPRAVARAAVVSAARRHMPGLLRGRRPAAPAGRPGRRPRRYPVGAAPWPAYQGGSYGFPTNGAASAEPGGPFGDEGADQMSDQPGGRPQTGRWIRRGRKIVLFGV